MDLALRLAGFYGVLQKASLFSERLDWRAQSWASQPLISVHLFVLFFLFQFSAWLVNIISQWQQPVPFQPIRALSLTFAMGDQEDD